MVRLTVLLSMVLGLVLQPADANELAVRQEIKSEAAHLLEQGDVATYDRRATQLRSTAERTPAGIWKLSLFYKGPDNWPAQQPDALAWAQIESATGAYMQEHPNSPSAVIAYARILVSHAWNYRGGGWGRDLTYSQRNGFSNFLERARVVLDQHRQVGSHDPEWYALRIDIMNGQNEDKATIMALAREALDHEPTYQPTYYAAANAFLPKWGGSAKQLQQFVALAVAKSEAEGGSQAYARIMFNIARADPQPVAALERVGVQWPTLRTSLRAIAAAYPDPWNPNAERAMACLLGAQADYDVASARSSPDLLSVAWFDSAKSWPACQKRQQLARQSAVATWAEAVIHTPPSARFVESLTAGIFAAWALFYLARRTRGDEPSTLQDFDGSRAIAGGGTATTGGGLLIAGEYPRVYPVSIAWKIGMLLLGATFVLGSLAAAWEFGVIAANTRDAVPEMILTFCLGVVASATAVYCVDILKSAIVLMADQLEIRELWRVRRVRRTDIETQQLLRQSSPAVLVLRLKAPSHRKIKLPMMWRVDSTWDKWFANIPNTDVEATKAFESTIDNNVELGTTPAERQQKLSNARSFAKIATFANTGLIAWAFLYPRPYIALILVLAVLPWAALWIMARSPDLYTLNAPRGSGRPDLTLLLISPGFILLVRAVQDVHILDWQRLLPIAALASIALIGGVIWAMPAAREKPGALALTLALLLAYGYGVASLGDALLDFSGGSVYPATVYGKFVTSGRNRTPTIELEPWGPRETRDSVGVPWDLYRNTAVGDKVCVHSFPGAFGIRWFRVEKCGPL